MLKPYTAGTWVEPSRNIKITVHELGKYDNKEFPPVEILKKLPKKRKLKKTY